MNKPKSLIIVLILLSACSVTHRSICFTKLKPFSVEEIYTLNQDTISLNLSFEGLNHNCLAIGLEMINKTNRPISVVPALFYYKASGRIKLDSIGSDCKYYSLDYQKERDSLILLKDSLSQAKNPYFKKRQSTCEEMKTGLINGTVELVLGLPLGSIEENREEDEENWKESCVINLNDIELQLTFWRHSALKETILAPRDTVEGSLLFPIDTTLNQIVFELPINNRIHSFPFKQTFRR